MGNIKIVGVKDLKNNLSAYLRDVQRGTKILVSDRSTVVAELHEPWSTHAAPEGGDPVLAAWLQDGVVIPPLRKKSRLPPSPVRVAESSALRLLDHDRKERDP